mgnify:CR=1 FL=1
MDLLLLQGLASPDPNPAELHQARLGLRFGASCISKPPSLSLSLAFTSGGLFCHHCRNRLPVADVAPEESSAFRQQSNDRPASCRLSFRAGPPVTLAAPAPADIYTYSTCTVDKQSRAGSTDVVCTHMEYAMQRQVRLTRKVGFTPYNLATPLGLDSCCDYVEVVMLVHNILQVPHNLFRP